MRIRTLEAEPHTSNAGEEFGLVSALLILQYIRSRIRGRSKCGDSITVVTKTEHEHVRFARAAKGRLCSWMVRVAHANACRVAAVIRCVPSLGTM
jgi:hypothetical protein